MKKNPKILIMGATGMLGLMILNFTFKNKIPIFAVTCFSNFKKLNSIKKKYSIKNTFCLNNNFDKEKFLLFCKSKKIDIIYFLDVRRCLCRQHGRRTESDPPHCGFARIR